MWATARAAWHSYASLLARRPYLTSAATGGCVMLSGDALAQYSERCRTSGGHAAAGYDKIRAGVMVGFSMGAFMPINTLWYRAVVEPLLPDLAQHRIPFPRGALAPAWLPFFIARTLGKGALACSPALVLNPIFFVWAPTAEAVAGAALSGGGGGDVDWSAVKTRVEKRFSEDLVAVVSNSYSLWVPVNCVNFVVTPMQYRIVVMAVISNFWNWYLSLIQHK